MEYLNGVPVSQSTDLGEKVPSDRKRTTRNQSSDFSDTGLEDGGPGFQLAKRQRNTNSRPDAQGMRNVRQTNTETVQKFTNVYLEAIDKRRLQPYIVARQLHNAKVLVDQIHSKGISQLQLRFSTKAEAIKLTNDTVLLQALKCTAKLSQPPSDNIKGVIRGVDIDITDSEMLAELSKATHYTILSTKRITRLNENKDTVPTLSVVLEFKGKVLPKSVYIYSISSRVEVYVTKPTICYRCQLYGHIAVQCKSPSPLCGFCTEKHNTRDCPKDRNIEIQSCINCQGTHPPNSTECPIMRHKFEARMQNTLRNTQYQPPPTIRSPSEFPTLEANNDTNNAQPVQRNDQQEQEPRFLPRKQQKAQVRKFSHVLASRYFNDEMRHEQRQQRYQHIAQREVPHRRPQNTAQRQESRDPPPQLQQLPTPPPPQHGPVEPPRHAGEQVDNIISQLLHSESAIRMLVMLLQLTVNASTSTENRPIDIQNVQAQLLKIWTTSSQILIDPHEMDTEQQETHLQTFDDFNGGSTN
jgi:hypothetical protein